MTNTMRLRRKNRVRHGSDVTSHVFFGCVGIVLVVFTVCIFGMLLWAFITSTKNYKDLIYDLNYLGLPNIKKYGFSSIWQNYKDIFDNFTVTAEETYYTVFAPDGLYYREVEATFWDMVGNSLIYAGLGSLLMTFVPATVAYVLSKYKFKFSKFVYGIALITYIIPIVGNYPAMMAVLRTLGLQDRWIGFFVMKFNFLGMYFFIFYSFFDSLNDSYIEAAELDGANQFQILFQVVFPLAKKMLVSVLLVVFIQLWNDFQTPHLYLPTHPTLAYGVVHMTNDSVVGSNGMGLTNMNYRMASVMTMALPIILIFILLKDKLMTNMTLGGTKD